MENSNYKKMYFNLMIEHEIPDENLHIYKEALLAVKEAVKCYGITVTDKATYVKSENKVIVEALVPVDLNEKLVKLREMSKEVERLKREQEALLNEQKALKAALKRKEQEEVFGKNGFDFWNHLFD